MNNYASSVGILEGVSNVYLLSTATLLLAIVIAFYCANFLKEDNLENEQPPDNMDEFNTDDNIDDISEHNEIFDKQCQQQPNNSESKNNLDQEFQLYSDGLVSKLKSARIKELEAQLTEQQLEEERRIEREQLAAIFELLKKQEADLNTKEIDESELSAQLNLYR